MKKILLSSLMLFAFVLTSFAQNTEEYNEKFFLLDGLTYTIDDNGDATVNLLQAKDTTTKVIVPEKVANPFISKEHMVVAISEQSFRNCDELKTVFLPSTLKLIGLAAFYGSLKLEAIYCAATEAPETSHGTFNASDSNIDLFVPKASVATYMKTMPYSFLDVQGYDFTTDINTTPASANAPEGIYTLNGIKIEANQMQKGTIYIVDGVPVKK